jgi:hypothetical protein
MNLRTGTAALIPALPHDHGEDMCAPKKTILYKGFFLERLR